MQYKIRHLARCIKITSRRGLIPWIAYGCAILALFALAWVKFASSRIGARAVQSLHSQSIRSDAQPKNTTGTTQDDAEINFVIVCGRHGFHEMQPMIKSILLLSTRTGTGAHHRAMRLIFLTDIGHVGAIQEIFHTFLHKTRHPLKVEIHIITEENIDSWARTLNIVLSQHPGRWALAKMMIPWLLPQLDRAIVVDADFVFVDDPTGLLQFFPSGSTQRAIYSMPLGDESSILSICSCIVLIDCARARQQKVYPELIQEAFNTVAKWRHRRWYSRQTATWNPMLGDQGIYWILFKKFPNLFQSLPNRWNVQKCNHFQGAFKPHATTNVSALHRNCSGRDITNARDAASAFFNFFIQYQWQWLRPVSNPTYFVSVTVFNSSAFFSPPPSPVQVLK